MKLIFFALAIAAGLSNPIQSAANSALNKGTHQPLLTAIALYAVAVATLLVLIGAYAAFRPFSLATLREAAGTLPWWVYVGGICNIVFVLVASVATQKIGSAPFTVTTLVAAVMLSLFLDGTGSMGLKKHPITWPRVAGAVLSIAGVAAVSLF